MTNIAIMANQAIERAKNLQEFLVFRDMDELVFDGKPMPYSINHVIGGPVEIMVPAISQDEAEQRVNDWLKGHRS